MVVLRGKAHKMPIIAQVLILPSYKYWLVFYYFS